MRKRLNAVARQSLAAALSVFLPASSAFAGTRALRIAPLPRLPAATAVPQDRLLLARPSAPTVSAVQAANAPPAAAAPHEIDRPQAAELSVGIAAPETQDERRRRWAGAVGAVLRDPFGKSGRDEPADAVEPPQDSREPNALAPARSAAPRPPSLYLLPKPLESTVELGRVGRMVHIYGYIVYQTAKALVVLALTHRADVVAGMLIWEGLTMAPTLAALSLAWIQLRYLFKLRSLLRPLAGGSGVQKIQVMNAGALEFQGPLARRQSNRGFVFLTATAPPPSDGPSGAPLAIPDPHAVGLRLTLDSGDVLGATHWVTSLGHVLGQTPIPAGIARQWRAESAHIGAVKSWFLDFVSSKAQRQIVQSLQLSATLLLPNGKEMPLSHIAQGHSALHLLHLSHWSRLSAGVRTAFPRLLKPLPERHINLSLTLVERRSEDLRSRREKIFQTPRRLWQRILGRLIVVRR